MILMCALTHQKRIDPTPVVHVAWTTYPLHGLPNIGIEIGLFGMVWFAYFALPVLFVQLLELDGHFYDMKAK